MPVVASQFQPPLLLRNGHVQTLLRSMLPGRSRVAFQRERLELDDGDFLDLDWQRTGHGRVAILSHGLEGSSTQTYMLGMAAALNAAGWDVLAWNFRGCSGEPNRLLRFYHSGETGDLAAVVRHATRSHARIALVGFSLGGNVLLKYLGEGAHPAVIGAAAISAPVDLASCARAADERIGNRIYLRRFLASLRAKIESKARQFPGRLEVNAIHSVRSFADFDERYTAPLHGFRDAEDYWARSSARPLLPRIAVPTLLLNARNDPLLAPPAFPWAEAEASPHFFFEAPASGGHVGFLDLSRGIEPWTERRVTGFFAGLAPM